MSRKATKPKTCFIAAPAGLHLDVLRECLQSHGLQVLVPQDLQPGVDWASEINKHLSRADLVIGVFTPERQSAWVLFELGQAWALRRRILLIAPPDFDLRSFPLRHFLVLRIGLENREAIDFALDQILSAPRERRRRVVTMGARLASLGAKADDLLSKFDRSLASSDWRFVENLVADAITSSGAEIVVASEAAELGADLAVWSDVLEPYVGNPLLVEVKGRIRGRGDVQRATEQLSSYLTASGAQWGLILYVDGPPVEDEAWSGCPPNVLVLPVRCLLELLRTRAFPELVRDLRNQRIHGVSL